MDERPDDSEPPPEELEMAVEEFLGRPMASGRGAAAERIEAITKRVAYLREQLVNPKVTDVHRVRVNSDLAEAEQQLSEWKRQAEGRN